MSSTEEKLSFWMIKRLGDLPPNPESTEKQKQILLEPKLASGLGKAWDIYCYLRRNGWKQEKIKEIFECEEDSLGKYMKDLRPFVKSSRELKEVVYESIKIVKEITGYTTRSELVDELVRQLERYGKARPFWPE